MLADTLIDVRQQTLGRGAGGDFVLLHGAQQIAWQRVFIVGVIVPGLAIWNVSTAGDWTIPPVYREEDSA